MTRNMGIGKLLRICHQTNWYAKKLGKVSSNLPNFSLILAFVIYGYTHHVYM